MNPYPPASGPKARLYPQSAHCTAIIPVVMTTIEHRQPCRGHHKHQCRGCQHPCVVSVVYLTGNKLCLPSIIICLCHIASVLICLEAGIHYCRVALCIGKCSAREINGRQRRYYST